MQPDSAAVGAIWHRRHTPRPHAFRYRAWFSLLDVDRIEERFARSRWWSIERANLVNFRRRDYLAPHSLSVGDAVRERVRLNLGFSPTGPIRILTHLRQWGLCFNPVSFYFCFASDGRTLQAIVADVHNTPWGERHAYVMDARGQVGPSYRWRFAKDFHVSPFLPMALDYDWRFSLTSEQVDVHMRVMDGDQECLGVGMRLELRPLDASAMWRMPLKFPWMTARVVLGIYWQAFRLWLKRTPFHDHPGGGRIEPGKET